MAFIRIIDDDEDYSAAIATTLRAAGHVVEEIHELEGALERIRARESDLLILDVMFPESSTAGFEMARGIAAAYGGKPPFPILMLTAVNEKFPLGFTTKDIDTDFLPVTAFVEKTVDLDVIVAKVAELL